MYNILTLNNIAAAGIQRFNSERYHLSNDTDKPDAIVLRSANMHSMQFPDSLHVVGRAGAGTNNIPIDLLTQRGIPVMNTPGANANAVKELVIAGMLLSCRHLGPAWAYVQGLQGDDASLHHEVEANKKRFRGSELPGKTLGVIGLGNIGVKVANAALNLGMRVIGYDPAITVRHAWELQAEVIQAEKLEDVLKTADFLTLHIPLNEHTRDLINRQRLALMKPSAVVLNFARDGIISNSALVDALNHDKLGGVVCDFPSQALIQHPNAICLPHLGASTYEAEEHCAVMIADQIQAYLEHGHIRHAVNFPDVKLAHRQTPYRLAVINANVPNMVAQISNALSENQNNIAEMINKSKGNIAYTLMDIEEKITAPVLSRISEIKGVIRARVIPNVV